MSEANEVERTVRPLPCPFCGGEAELTKTDFSRPVMHWVHCVACGSSAGAYEEIKHAESAWNHRAA